MRRRHSVGVVFVACMALLSGTWGCADKKPSKKKETPAHKPHERVDSRPIPMHKPVSLWEAGKSERKVDAAVADVEGYVLVDLGEEWTPYIFSAPPGAEPAAYRKTYLALAKGIYPDNHHGERARVDEYLELYGIMPTLSLLRTRFIAMSKRACINEINFEPLKQFQGFVAYRQEKANKETQRAFVALERRVSEIVRAAGVSTLEELNVETLLAQTRGYVSAYVKQAPRVAAIRAAQARLECEGYFEGLGQYIDGVLDWRTHEALARFERRHRVYGWGYIGKDTLEKLRVPSLELERDAVLRVLTERAMHAAGVLEDGTTSFRHDGTPRTYRGADGKPHPIRNLEAELRDDVRKAFALDTPDSTLGFLNRLGTIPAELLGAVKGPELPEYYSKNMDLYAEIDKGDVWYDFPFDEQGLERPQPRHARPALTLYARYHDQSIPLARYGTTIGGWRSDFENGHVMWRFKDSPVGSRMWQKIVAAPVWLPPESTPHKDLLQRSPKKGVEWEVDYHEMGPSYASAYGLVAAYHLKYQKRPDGTLLIGGDEGIRTHGSVDYMSVARRHSHGCHRLQNHLAVRLMSFILAHRTHTRIGQKRVALERDLEYDGKIYKLQLREGGYEFQLHDPVEVVVTEGRIRGKSEKPIKHAIPKFDVDAGAYVTPDGGAVEVSPTGRLTDIPLPVKDAGVSIPGMETVPQPYGMPGSAPPPAAPSPVTPSVPAPAPTAP